MVRSIFFLSPSIIVGLNTQDPIEIATVHSSPYNFDSSVGIIKIRLYNRKHSMSCLFDESSISISSPTTSPTTSCSQMIG